MGIKARRVTVTCQKCYNPKIITMKKKTKKTAVITGAVFAVFAIVFIIFQMRSPVLIVTDMAFIPLYGDERIRDKSLRSSLVLFRPVKTVIIANDAGDDIVLIAINDISSRPHCVIFPLRFAHSARQYREQNPLVPVIILGNRYEENFIISALGGNANDYYIYTTDVHAEFHRVGLIAAALDMNKNGRIAVFMENNLQTQVRETFSNALNSGNSSPQAVFYSSFSSFSGSQDFSCVILAGTGSEYMDRESDIPVIIFTWIDPDLLSSGFILVIDDSPWAQTVQAVRMASQKMPSGRILSEFTFLKSRNADIGTLRKM